MSKKSVVMMMAVVSALAGAPAVAQTLSEGLTAKAAKSGSVRVIVQFAEPSTAAALESDLSGTADVKHTKALRAVQSSILTKALGSTVAAAAADSASGATSPHAVRLMDVSPDNLDAWLAAQAEAEAKRMKASGHALPADATATVPAPAARAVQ